MLELLDTISELVCVVDIETHELLYMNISGKEQFKVGALNGLKCYQVFQGRESPCDFCTTPYLTEDSYYKWETISPVTGRRYRLKDRLISWQGRPARLQIAFDLNKKQCMLETENVLIAEFMNSVRKVKQYRRQLKELRFVDTLTGVFNHKAFTQELKRDVELLASPVGVVYLSVNNTKELNDCNGRDYGDRVLTDTAQTLQSMLDSAKVYRVGGDEFVAIWKNAESEAFNAGIQKIKTWQEQEVSAKSAVGYSWVESCTNLQELVAKAEEWMYRRKKAFYRDRVLPRRYRHYNDKALKLADSSTLEQMFVQQRFLVYFQPKFAVANRKIIGVEALARFVDADGQILPPDQFIPLLEEARLIERLDFYVFEYVCAKISQWLEEGRPVAPVAVNFSRYTIQEPWFRDMLLKVWEKYHLSKTYIEIEITESAEENGGEELLALLAQLSRDGFRVSIDDFGVKYANLSIFTNGEFSTLKIDKSLMSNWENQRTREVLRVLCDICQRTDVYLVAEGVELEEQLTFLQQIGCEGAQGFLFSRPLPLCDYERLYLGNCADVLHQPK